MTRKIGMSASENSTEPKGWKDYLSPDERLLWQDAPADGIRFSPMLAVLSGFGLFFTAIPIIGLSLISIDTGTMMDYVIYGFFAVFMLIGLTLVIAPWLIDAHMRKHTRYALTNARAIIANTAFGRTLSSYPVTTDAPLELINGNLDTVNFAFAASGSRQRDTGGDMQFNPLTSSAADKRGTAIKSQGSVGFRFIQDGRAVYKHLIDVRNSKV